MEPYFILAFVIVLPIAVGLIIITFFFGGGGKRSRVAHRLEEIKRHKLSDTIIESEQRGNLFSKLLMGCGRLISQKSEVKRRNIERKLNSAGIYSEKAMLIYLGLRVLVPFVLLLIVFVSIPVLRYYPMAFVFAALCSLLLGTYGPSLVLRFMARKRKSGILKGFPDALDLLAVCVEAGVSFDTAIKKVAEDMAFSHKHIAREFMVYIYETQIGIPRHEALRNLAERTDVDIIRSFISLLIQSNKLGTSIGQTLRVYSDSLRTKRRQDAETKAARLPVMMIFPLLFFIFPSLYVVILGPATISIFRNFVTKSF